MAQCSKYYRENNSVHQHRIRANYFIVPGWEGWIGVEKADVF
jgi:hypothetical protein